MDALKQTIEGRESMEAFAHKLEPVLTEVFSNRHVRDVRCGITTDILIKVIEEQTGASAKPLLGIYIEPLTEQTAEVIDYLRQTAQELNLDFENIYTLFSSIKLLTNSGEIDLDSINLDRFRGPMRVLIESIVNKLKAEGKAYLLNVEISKHISHVLAEVQLQNDEVYYVDLNAWQFGEQFDRVSVWDSLDEIAQRGIFPFAEAEKNTSASIEEIQDIYEEVVANL